MSLFTDGIVSTAHLEDPSTAEALFAATDRAADRPITPADLLHSLIALRDPTLDSALSFVLVDGARLRDVLDSIDVYSPADEDPTGANDGRRESFSPDALAALDEFGAWTTAHADLTADRRQRLELEVFAACVLENLGETDRRNLPILDAARGAALLRERVRTALEPPPALVDEETGRLRVEEFSDASWAVLEEAGRRAADLGYDRVMPPHCFLALLGETEGPLEHLVRLQTPPSIGTAKVASLVTDAFRLREPRNGAVALPPHRDAVSDSLMDLLHAARRSATSLGSDRVGTIHLIGALLENPSARLLHTLESPPLSLDVARLRGHMERALREEAGTAQRETPFRLPSSLPPNEDLTFLARSGRIPAAPHLDRYFDPLLRTLFRTTSRHALITGLPGVGTTTLLRELARRAASGDIPFLARKRFLHVDCRDVPPAEGGTVLSRIMSHSADRTDLVVCLDGLGALLSGPEGADHRLILRGALQERRIHLIGVLTKHDFDDLISPDRVLLGLVGRVDVEEPDRDTARAMVGSAAEALSAEFGVVVTEEAVERSVSASADFILNERLPAKAVRTLRMACEDLHYRRTQGGSEQEALGRDDIDAVVADVSGVPVGQITGEDGQRIDLEAALRRSIVGQDHAVTAVAKELRRIKAGLSGMGGRPASVMFFAGLTGVGKTELAKTLARFYSASKLLKTYPMANFTEHHSVAGILGSPPGYIGHQEGGRLINDLNSDPYCVFLMDEAEKAHPEVWRPFLNLFDEGWITDQRGTKAFGDRAIFVLTSNAGHEIIQRMTAEGRSREEITAAVESALREERHKRSDERVFTPEFLARIDRVIVFQPLGLDAMTGICRMTVDSMRDFWRTKRNRELVVPDRLLHRVAALGHFENQSEDNTKGGRVIRKWARSLLEDPILAAQEERPDEFRACTRIDLSMRDAARSPAAGFGRPPVPRVEVSFHGDRGAAVREEEVPEADAREATQ